MLTLDICISQLRPKKVPKWCQNLAKVVQASQKLQNFAQRLQRMFKDALKWHKTPKDAKICPKVSMNGFIRLRIPKYAQGCPDMPKNAQKSPINSKEWLLDMPKDIQICPSMSKYT